MSGWEELHRRVATFKNGDVPEHELGPPVVAWLATLPPRLRQATFMLWEGYEVVQRRADYDHARRAGRRP